MYFNAARLITLKKLLKTDIRLWRLQNGGGLNEVGYGLAQVAREHAPYRPVLLGMELAVDGGELGADLHVRHVLVKHQLLVQVSLEL